MSAVASVSTSGVYPTRIPLSLACCTSMCSNPTLYALMILSLLAESITSLSILSYGKQISPSASAIPDSISSRDAGPPECTSTWYLLSSSAIAASWIPLVTNTFLFTSCHRNLTHLYDSYLGTSCPKRTRRNLKHACCVATPLTCACASVRTAGSVTSANVPCLTLPPAVRKTHYPLKLRYCIWVRLILLGL